MIDVNEAAISASVGDNLDAALDAKADKSEIARLDAALAGKEAAGTVEAHNDSASAHPDIRNELKEKLEASDLSCHNTNATAHTDIRSRLDGKVDKASGMGLSSNDFTASEKADVATNTAMRHNHNNKALLDSYTQSDANLSDAVERKHSHENKAVLDGITAAQTDDWCNAAMHMADPVKHITAAERSSWNGKADKTYVDSSLAGKANATQLCNPNLLINPWFGAGVINQRGQTLHTGIGYGIDMWKSNALSSSVEVTENGIKLRETNGGDGGFTLWQVVENYTAYTGMPLTVSALVTEVNPSDGTYYRLFVGNVYGQRAYTADITAPGLYSVTLPPQSSLNDLSVVFRHNAPNVGGGTTSITVKVVKLEVGNLQTLAYTGNNGNWILMDPPPNPQQELAKCQRYFYRLEKGAAFHGVITADAKELYFLLPKEMRSTPTISMSSDFSVCIRTVTGYSPLTPYGSTKTPNSVTANSIPTNGLARSACFGFTEEIGMNNTPVYIDIRNGYLNIDAEL